MIDFLSSPEPATKGQRIAFWAASAIVAVSRIWGRAHSPWDWDEILFSLALKHYDVASHHPHPPGFPLFIGAAKLFGWAGIDHFHSLQLLNLIAGALLIPAMVLLCRELRFRFSTSLIAGLILAFFPNVWFFGETAFSDVPSVVLVVAACGFLLRGCRSGRSYLLGAILLGVAAGFRPQNLTIGLAPALIATWYQLRARSWLRVTCAMIAGALILGGSYYAAALASGGWTRYGDAIRAHQQYIASVDSFRSPTRPPLHHLVDDFFVRPYHAPPINAAVTIFVLVSLILALLRLRWPVLLTVFAFGPFAIAAWLILDHFSASRFSIGYAPMLAILAADGMARLSLAARDRRVVAENALAALLVGLMIAWAAPAIELARASDSPPVQAINWIRQHADRSQATLYIHEGMGPYAEELLADFKTEWVSDGVPIADLRNRPAFYLREGGIELPGSRHFAWPHDRLWNIVRRRYFEVTVVPVPPAVQFLDGWYDAEETATSTWRWMGRRARLILPRSAARMRLELRFFVPLHVLPGRPVVEVRLNGTVLDRIVATQSFVERRYEVPSSPNTSNELVIETDRIINPLLARVGDDGRDLGLRLEALQWIALDPPE